MNKKNKELKIRKDDLENCIKLRDAYWNKIKIREQEIIELKKELEKK